MAQARLTKALFTPDKRGGGVSTPAVRIGSAHPGSAGGGKRTGRKAGRPVREAGRRGAEPLIDGFRRGPAQKCCEHRALKAASLCKTKSKQAWRVASDS